jgi:ferredoxin
MVAEPAMSAERVVVDPTRCVAAGLCAELLPETIELDEWGYPIIDRTPVDGRLQALARRAAASCPVRALHLLAIPEPVPAPRDS